MANVVDGVVAWGEQEAAAAEHLQEQTDPLDQFEGYATWSAGPHQDGFEHVQEQEREEDQELDPGAEADQDMSVLSPVGGCGVIAGVIDAGQGCHLRSTSH